MKIFIFGAGASAGSQNRATNTVERSPVTNQIFDQIYREKYAHPVGLYLDEVEEYIEGLKKFDNSLESWLTDWWSKTEKLEDQYLKESDQSSIATIAYYLWWLFQNISRTYDTQNLYRDICKKVKGTNFTFISFNYDTLLDKAVMQIFKKNLTGSLDNYINARLLKPHGSVNWFLNKRDVDAPFPETHLSGDTSSRYRLAATQMYKNGSFDLTNVSIRDPFLDEIQNIDVIRHAIFNYHYFFPMIFLPLTKKQYNFVKDFYEKIIDAARINIAAASDVYVLGYRAQDAIIKDMFTRVQPHTKLHVVGHGNAGSIADSLLKNFSNFEKGTIHENGFENFVKEFKP